MRWILVASGLLTLGSVPTASAAQQWNSPEALAVVERARARRVEASQFAFRDFTAHAQGFVMFLAQVGEGFPDEPQLIQADQLALEVYWMAPGRSKQRIIGRRAKVELPSGIQYHRDHLGIVQDNYPDRIRMGQCDEVCNVPHPLARAGGAQYDFAVVDSLRIDFMDGSIRVVEILVRPKDPEQARVAGSLYLDRDTGQVIRLRFRFTAAAYRDDTLEDITVLLDNAFWDRRHWLPRHQVIEIRRRTAWLDLPARSIIRITLDIDEYEFDTGVPDTLFRGPEIVQAADSIREGYPWQDTIEHAMRRRAGAVDRLSLTQVREQVEDVLAGRLLTQLSTAQFGAPSVSDFAHFNRVEGLTLGFGATARPARSSVTLRGGFGYGFGDRRIKARLAVSQERRWGSWRLEAAREVRDLSDEPMGSGVVNSLLAQELGEDSGDYYELDRLSARLAFGLGRARVSLTFGPHQVRPVDGNVSPASGIFRPNPSLGNGRYWIARANVSSDTPISVGIGEISSVWAIEGGGGEDIRYVRSTLRVDGRIPAGGTEIAALGWVGIGSESLPPHRRFALGGRGTLVGEAFRSWGGRTAASARVEWRIAIGAPAIGLGRFGSTGDQMVVAPFAGAVWAWRSDGSPWLPSDGPRPAVGMAVEAFHRIVRFELGASLRNPQIRATIDIRRDLWPIL